LKEKEMQKHQIYGKSERVKIFDNDRVNVLTQKKQRQPVDPAEARAYKLAA